LSDLPYTNRGLMPAPAMTDVVAVRPVVAAIVVVAVAGGRTPAHAGSPNSPTATTSVSLSRPRSSRSAISADRPASSIGPACVFMRVESRRGRPTVVVGIRDLRPVDSTNRVPASISRRPSRQHWAERVLAVAGAGRVGFLAQVEGVAGPGRNHQPQRLAVVVVDVVLGNGFFQIRHPLGDGVAQVRPPLQPLGRNLLPQLQVFDRDASILFRSMSSPAGYSWVRVVGPAKEASGAALAHDVRLLQRPAAS